MSVKAAGAIALATLGGCGGAVVARGAGTRAAGQKAAGRAPTPASPGAIDPTVVPLGDGYVSTSPKVGYVDSCITHFGGIGGARTNGPWIDTSTKSWNYETKLAVQGNVAWSSTAYSVRTTGGRRVIRFDDLPINHTTGVFPIASSDPAHAYDQNGNHIAAQRVSWSLPLHPKAAKSPSCTGGGSIGVLSDGVFLYNALDGEGRDAGAHEVLDRCAGHPDPSNSYHHHDVPPCLLRRVPNGSTRLVGYALDGFGIYVVKDRNGHLPSNTQLDACHGTTGTVTFDGRRTRIYHYVATLEYPYTVGCFRGTPISSGHGGGPPPGGGAAGGGPPPGAGRPGL